MTLERSDRTIALPTPSLVFLLGASGSGKSRFAERHFDSFEVVSMDACRRFMGHGLEGSSAVAHELLHTLVDKRLEAGELVVVDADCTEPEARRALIALSRKHHLFAIAIAFDVDERVCIERNAARAHGAIPPHEVLRQSEAVRTALKTLARDGVRDVHVLRRPEDADEAIVVRSRLWTDRRNDHGPFDVIGDVHGCADELVTLLELLGYRVVWDSSAPHGVRVVSPPGRRIIFLGDLVDRGPRIVDVLRIAMSMVDCGTALCIPGNHEAKLLKKLRGKPISITHGLAETLAELDAMPQAFRDEVANFIDRLVGHYMLDDGRLCVVHAGIKERMQGRSSAAVREFGLYGDTTGETDEYGLPVRHDWANEYKGTACVVYGHTPTLLAEWVNNTICIDTGCVFGGALTALRYPEREIVSVPAAKQYCAPRKPLANVATNGATPSDDLLDFDELRRGGVVTTRLYRDVAVREESAAAALEMLSRFCVDPRWLVYLPPTTPPVGASVLPGILEHPVEAFSYYRKQGVSRIVCQEKHRGTRAVVVVCRDVDTARRIFRVDDGRVGIVYSRTGRPFFSDEAAELAFLERIRAAASKSGLFDELGPFVILDGAMVPRTTSAENAARRRSGVQIDADFGAGVNAAIAALSSAEKYGVDVDALRRRMSARFERLQTFVQTGERWRATNVCQEKQRYAPFQIAASEGVLGADRDHGAHLEWARRLAEADAVSVVATRYIDVVLGDAASERAAVSWWEELIASGEDGIVIKPAKCVSIGPQGLVQPALVCRGREALQWVFGPEFDMSGVIERVAHRHLVVERSDALRQFALGIEGLTRFVEMEPLQRIHACVMAILALECERVEVRSS